ncbi:STAS-like domain-containing protein [Flavobacterium sp. Sr18]|jgi:hypothetical protein|uniref:STAS-like domain-containing protein n=1 Tax=Flavobacterium sp. Sr18 TaxID=935222 RepID=UPI0013E44A34|nr:STAS-like domain-containing protein [Flavobacterium sp. Sr18]QIH38729.1 STAS-like domain-containing protein [Flavobacterium sp. Sr18]
MKTIVLNQYGPIISNKEIGEQILKLIETSLAKEQKIKINLADIKSMATFCAKQIFGFLYLKLGPESFFDRIEFINTSNDLKTIIKIGIQSALEMNQES